MNEEECTRAINFLSLSADCGEDFKAIAVLEQLIDEHFDPRPYKFEELEPNMWVWDDKLKTLYKIKKIMHCHWFKAEYRSFVLDVKTEERKYHTGIMEFEEGRFYPAAKAMLYKGCENDD